MSLLLYMSIFSVFVTFISYMDTVDGAADHNLLIDKFSLSGVPWRGVGRGAGVLGRLYRTQHGAPCGTVRNR